MKLFWKSVSILVIFVIEVTGEVEVNEFASNALYSVLEKVYSERPYKTIFLQRRFSIDCVDENLQLHFKSPHIVYGANATIYLKGNYSSKLLAIACMNTTTDKEFVEKLATNLQHMRDTRIIIIVNAALFESNEDDLTKLFELCKKLKLLNVNLLHRDFSETRLYHSYTHFPVFQLETRVLSENPVVFPYRLSDLKGKVLITLPDQIVPRTMLYNDSLGRQQMSGYIGKFIRAFADQYNCIFKFPHNLSTDELMHVADLRAYVRNESVDIPASISTPQRDLNIHEYTYPIEVIKWVNMLPIEPPVPIYRLLVSVFSIEYILIILLQCCLISLLLMIQNATRSDNGHGFGYKLLIVFCTDASLRGTLGQSFDMPKNTKPGIKFTYILLFLAGIIVSTSFAANLSQLITAPPRTRQISSYDDLMKTKLKILMPQQEITNVEYFRGKKFWRQYKSVFAITTSFPEFMDYRNNFNPTYAYPITTSVWPMLQEQQKYFSRKLFRLSTDLYYCICFVYGIPLNENSFYKEPLNLLIGRIIDSGIYQYWYTMAFYDMVELGRMSFTDLSTPRTIQPLYTTDFFWIWVLYCSSMCICVLVFLVEKYLFRTFSEWLQ